MDIWKSFKDVPRDGTPVLVQLEKPILGSVIQVGQFRKKGASIISSQFAFDCPKVLFWTELPEPKQITHKSSRCKNRTAD